MIQEAGEMEFEMEGREQAAAEHAHQGYVVAFATDGNPENERTGFVHGWTLRRDWWWWPSRHAERRPQPPPGVPVLRPPCIVWFETSPRGGC